MKATHLYRITLVVSTVLTLAVLLSVGGTAGLRFPHPVHQEMGLECGTCHTGVEASASGLDHFIPTEEVCLDCHEAEDLEIYGWKAPKATDRGLPTFSHKAHLAMEEVECATCHGALLDPLLTGTGVGVPSHELCFGCHDGGQATNECESCHSNLHAIRPLDHQVDYLHSHQFSARSSAGACEECHRESDLCSECHQGENVLLRTHDRNYLFNHGQDAVKQEHDCTSCHEIESFCNDCHKAEGITPADHLPRNEWANFVTGGQHATEARKDIERCAACHGLEVDAFSCSNCHRDLNEKGDQPNLNIHSDDISSLDYKGAWHDDEMYFCFDCHVNRESADGFCSYCHATRR